MSHNFLSNQVPKKKKNTTKFPESLPSHENYTALFAGMEERSWVIWKLTLWTIKGRHDIEKGVDTGDPNLAK